MYQTDELPSTFEECKELYLFFVSMSSSSSRHPMENTINGLKTTLQYRLLKFVCPLGLLESELLFVRSFEKQYPKFYFNVPSDLLRHKVCDCAKVAPLVSVQESDIVCDDSSDVQSLEQVCSPISRQSSIPRTVLQPVSECEASLLEAESPSVENADCVEKLSDCEPQTSPTTSTAVICSELSQEDPDSSVRSSNVSEVGQSNVASRQLSTAPLSRAKRRRNRKKRCSPPSICCGQYDLCPDVEVDLCASPGFDTTWHEASDRVRLRTRYRYVKINYKGHQFNLDVLDQFFNVNPDYRYGRSVYAMDINDFENTLVYTLQRLTKYDLTSSKLTLHHLALRQFIMLQGDWRPPE